MSWSPDGKSLLFSTYENGHANIYRLDIDDFTRGIAPRIEQVSPSQAHDLAPIWSPDGEWIVFASNRNGNWDIYRVRSDGSELQNLTQSWDGEISPMWSSDGEWIIYEIMRDRFGRMRPDGTERERIFGGIPDVIEKTAAPIIDMPWHGVLSVMTGLMILATAFFAFFIRTTSLSH